MSRSKCLVTGANGFIGSHLCHALVKKGFNVHGLILKDSDPGTTKGSALNIHEGDITQIETLTSAFNGVSHVFHCAAPTIDWGPRDLFFRGIEMGTENVLKMAIRAGAQRFIHMSSLAVHQLNDHFQSDESCPLDSQINHYAISKIAAEKLVSKMGNDSSIETVIIRPGFFVYGPGDKKAFIPLVNSIKRGWFRFIGNGNTRITTSYVENLVQGMIQAAFAPGIKHDVFILSDDEAISWRQLSQSIAREIGAKLPQSGVPFWLVDFLAFFLDVCWRVFKLKKTPPITKYRVNVPRYNLIFSNQKAKKLIGFQPAVAWTEGVKRTLRWMDNPNLEFDL